MIDDVIGHRVNKDDDMRARSTPLYRFSWSYSILERRLKRHNYQLKSFCATLH